MSKNTVENRRPLGVPLHPVTDEQVQEALDRLDATPPAPHNCPSPQRIPLQGTPWMCACGKRWLAMKPGWKRDMRRDKDGKLRFPGEGGT
jgi:hypothetical protein